MDSYKVLQQHSPKGIQKNHKYSHSPTGIQKNHKYSQTRGKLTMLLLWEDGYEMS
jgi:hypothetical protein